MPLVPIAISALPFLVMFVCRHPMLMLCAFPVFEMVGVLAQEYAFNAGGIDFLPMDPAIFFAFACLAVSFLRYPRKVVDILKENIFVTVFLALVALYVVIYTPIYGQSAIGEARKEYAILLVPVLALLVIKEPEDLRRFVQVTILATAIVAMGALGIGAMRGSISKSVGAEGALMITLAAFAMLIHRFYLIVVFHPIMDRVLLFLFAALAIGLGHRTVWLGIGFGVMLVFWFYFARPVFVIKCVVVLLMLLMAGGSTLVYFSPVAGSLGGKFAGIIDPSSDDTASWRMEGWSTQLDELIKQGRLLSGGGLGGYYSWNYNTTTFTSVPHNGYVQIILKFGLFGLSIYGLLAL